MSHPDSNYRIEGAADAPVVVLAHGIATDLSLWDGVAPRLVAAGYCVLRYDARGHGGSAAPSGPYSLADLGGDLTDLLDDLHITSAHIVGLSMGGMVGLGLALDHPTRLLSLMCCDARASAPPDYRDAWTARADTVRAHGMGAMVEPSLSRWFAPGFRERQPAEADRVAAMVRGTAPRRILRVRGGAARPGLRPEAARHFGAHAVSSGCGRLRRAPCGHAGNAGRDPRVRVCRDSWRRPPLSPRAARGRSGRPDHVFGQRASYGAVSMSRLPTISPGSLSPEQEEAYNRIATGARGGVRGPFTALLHSPALASRVEQLGVYLRYQCAVPERLRELAIVVVAAHWRCSYEWYAHAPLAERLGHDKAMLQRLGRREEPDLADPAEAATYCFCSELVRSGQVGDGTHTAATDLLGVQGIVDLTGLVGYYTMLAFTLNAHDVMPPPGTQVPWR